MPLKRTITVKELIKELLEYDMDEPVYIGLGAGSKPDGCAGIEELGDYCAGGLHFEFGVYLIPREHLEEVTENA